MGTFHRYDLYTVQYFYFYFLFFHFYGSVISLAGTYLNKFIQSNKRKHKHAQTLIWSDAIQSYSINNDYMEICPCFVWNWKLLLYGKWQRIIFQERERVCVCVFVV